MNIAATYDYYDRFGGLVYQVVRLEPKDFRQRRPDGNGGWIWSLDGVERVPYRLPELLGSAPDSVFIPEGERDAECLRDLGFTATTNAGGAEAGWTSGMIAYLAGRDCVILIDNDATGLERGARLCESLNAVAKTIRVVWLPGPSKSDVTDFFDAGHTLKEFQEIVQATPLWEPPTISASGDPSDWPDLRELQPELPAVPDFNIENLPVPLRGLVEEVSNGMQVPYDFSACATIVSLAGCVGHRALVQPKALDSSWREVCNLWGMNVGSPGLMKSPILKLITRPLEKIQSEWNETQEADTEIYEKLKKEIELEQAVWESSYKVALKSGKPLPPRPEDTLWKPGERRLLITDCTFEMLHQIQSQNAAGVFQVRDELVGFFCGLEREGREGERQYWLQNWNGDGGFTVDRIGRGSIFVPNVCASLFGNAVPARLRYYLTSVLTGAPTDDGFLQRFQAVTWPDTPKTWRYIDRINSNTAANAAEQVYRSLVRLSGKHPLQLRFNSVSQALFVDWLTRLELRLRGDALPPVMVSHVSKFRKFMPVLSAIFELADSAARGDLETKVSTEPTYLMRARQITLDEPPQAEASQATLITATNTQRAIALCDYFEGHARRVYSSIVSPEIRAGHALARHIKRGDLEPQFSSRDISRRCWADVNTTELITAALQHLVDLNWIRPLELPLSPRGGRPSEVWTINPKLSK
jgi:hypothetical protein